MPLEEEIKILIEPTIKKAGYKLVGVKIGFQNRSLTLIITIDKEGGVSVGDCARVSRLVEPVLDEKDFIKKKYYLMVSSPGTEKP